MFTHILIPIDGSDPALQAARRGIALARSLKARVTALVVTLPWATYFSRELAVVVPGVVVPEAEYDGKCIASATRILHALEGEARVAGIAITSTHRVHQHPHQAIVREAAKESCDLIIMGSHHGFTGALLGSETMAVLAHTGIPVLAYRFADSPAVGPAREASGRASDEMPVWDRGAHMYKHILIATDGSVLAAKAVTTGLELARALGARVTCINASEPWTAIVGADGPALVFPVDEYERKAAAAAARILQRVQDQARQLGVACTTVHLIEFPAEAIIAAAAEHNCDLIVMASHGRRGIGRLLLGSQAAKVVTLSTLPVLICR